MSHNVRQETSDDIKPLYFLFPDAIVFIEDDDDGVYKYVQLRLLVKSIEARYTNTEKYGTKLNILLNKKIMIIEIQIMMIVVL